MSDYVTVYCMESCPKCKNLMRMVWCPESIKYEYNMYEIDCKYIKNIIISPWTKCNGMFEPREVKE